MRTTYSRQSIAAYNRTRYGQHTGVSNTLLRETIAYQSNEPVVPGEQDHCWYVASRVNALHQGEAGWTNRYYVVRYDGAWSYSCADESVRKYCRSAVEAFWQGQVA